MRIAIDLSGVDEHTGVRVYAAQLLRELQQADTDHEFIVIMRRRDLSLYPLHRREFNTVFIPRAAERALANIAWHWTSYRNLLQEQGIDLVHQLDCNRVSLLGGYAHVITVHGLIDSRVPGRRHFVRQHYNAVLVPRLLHLATHVISVSSNTRRDLLRYTRVPDERITVIHEGCSLGSDDDMTESAARALLHTHYGIRSDFILYVARLEHPNKNHISLLKAYELLSRHNASLPHLVFVGGDSYRADVVKQAVNSFSLKERVTLTGFIPDKHLSAFYRCALAYACPTVYEGFGLPLLEAMQFGVPIVCSDSSSLPEVVGDAALQFPPHDISSIAAALDALLSNAVLRGRLIEQGHKQLEKFSGKAMAEKTLQVYQDAMRACRRPLRHERVSLSSI